MTSKIHCLEFRKIILSYLGMLSKLRHFVPHNVITSVYYAIFSSLLHYGSIVWGQKTNSNIKRLETIQNKALRVINFAPFNAPTNELYKNNRILKFKDQIRLQNILLVHDDINRKIPYALQNTFKPLSDTQSYQTRGVKKFKMSLNKF